MDGWLSVSASLACGSNEQAGKRTSQRTNERGRERTATRLNTKKHPAHGTRLCPKSSKSERATRTQKCVCFPKGGKNARESKNMLTNGQTHGTSERSPHLQTNAQTNSNSTCFAFNNTHAQTHGHTQSHTRAHTRTHASTMMVLGSVILAQETALGPACFIRLLLLLLLFCGCLTRLAYVLLPLPCIRYPK